MEEPAIVDLKQFIAATMAQEFSGVQTGTAGIGSEIANLLGIWPNFVAT